MAKLIFGSALTLSTGRVIPVRWLGAQQCAKISALCRLSPTGQGLSGRYLGWGALSNLKARPGMRPSVGLKPNPMQALTSWICVPPFPALLAEER